MARRFYLWFMYSATFTGCFRAKIASQHKTLLFMAERPFRRSSWDFLWSRPNEHCQQFISTRRMALIGRLYAFVAFAEPGPTANGSNRPVAGNGFGAGSKAAFKVQQPLGRVSMFT